MLLSSATEAELERLIDIILKKNHDHLLNKQDVGERTWQVGKYGESLREQEGRSLSFPLKLLVHKEQTSF